MPKSRSVLKRQRQTLTRTMRNKSTRSELKTREKQARTATGDEAQAAFRAVQQQLDAAASAGVIHPNKAARKKRRILAAQRRAAEASSG